MPKLPIPTIRPFQQHSCNRSTTAQVATPVLASTAATSASGTTIVVSGATWTTNQYQNDWVVILTGTGAGQTRNITSNTSTTLTVPTWTVTPDNTSTFQIVQPTYPGLQGSLMSPSTGGTVLVGVTYREVIPIAGATQVTVRLKTTTAVGTVTLTPVRLLAVNPDDPAIYQPDGSVDTTKVQKYSTGGSTATAVVAGTELDLSINPAGEAYCLVEFAVTTAGTLNYCDVMTLQSGGASAGGGSSSVSVSNFPATQPVSIAAGQVAAGALLDGADATQGTTADAAVTNPALSATEIAALKGILTVLQAAPTAPTPVDGWVAAGSAATGENPVLVGGSDSSGNVQNVPLVLLNLAATYATQLGLMTKSLLASRDGTTIITNSSPHDIGADAVSLNNGASVGAFVYDSVAGAWDRLQGPIGDNQGPTGVIADVGLRYNGTTNKYDRLRNNVEVTALASAATTTTRTSSDIITYNARGTTVILAMTSVGTGSVTITINGKDSLSGNYYTMLTGSAVVTNSTNVYRIFPGATAAANSVANDQIPRIIQVVVTSNNANSTTYSVNCQFAGY